MSREYPGRVSGVRDEYDSTDGVWAYMLDRSGSEDRIYFEQYDAWVSEEDYSAGFRAWSRDNADSLSGRKVDTFSDEQYVAYVFDYCMKNERVHFTHISDAFTEGFIDAI